MFYCLPSRFFALNVNVYRASRVNNTLFTEPHFKPFGNYFKVCVLVINHLEINIERIFAFFTIKFF